MPPIVMHANVVEPEGTLADLCERAAALGFDGVEFRRNRPGVAETPEEYLDAVADEVARHGLRHVVFGMPGVNLTLPDGDLRRSEIEGYIAFMRLATARLPVRLFNLVTGPLTDPLAPAWEWERHGSALASAEQWSWSILGCQVIAEAAAELGVLVVLETRPGTIHDLPAAALKLVKRVGNVALGITLDYDNIACHPQGPDLAATLELVEPHLHYVHLKNSWRVPGLPSGHAVRCGLGEGAIDHRALLRRLVAMGYRGPLCLETPRAGDREWFVGQDLRYLQAVLADLAPGNHDDRR